jgi:hypothetical protein
MAQAYEYDLVSANSDGSGLTGKLAAKDAEGWEVIGFNSIASSPYFHVLIRRRLGGAE